MFEYISGRLATLTPTEAVVDCSGIGYLLNISLTTFDALNGLEPMAQVKLLVHEIIREDAHLLFGFATNRERSLMRALIGVSGVGANTARMILSSIPPAELEQVIVNGNAKQLKAVKGIGAKTAERIIVDLRDKIKPLDDTFNLMPTETKSEVYDEALAALTMLGFPRPQSQKVLKKIFESNPSAKVEEAIKTALTMM